MDKKIEDLLEERFDRIEAQIADVKTEVEKLKKRASAWGAVTGALTALATGFIRGG